MYGDYRNVGFMKFKDFIESKKNAELTNFTTFTKSKNL